MANLIVNNENSFYQWQQYNQAEEGGIVIPGCIGNACADVFQPCLPIFNLKDVGFQFIVEDTDEGWVSDIGLGFYLGECPPSDAEYGDPDFILGDAYQTKYFEISTGTFLVWCDMGNETIVNDICSVLTGGECVTMVLFNASTGALIACSNCLKFTPDICYTKRIKYRCNENSLGFYYEPEYGAYLTFWNTARVYLTLHSAQFPKQKKVFKLSDGSYKKLHARVDKEYLCLMDFQVEQFHQAMSIALEHDFFYIYDHSRAEWVEKMNMDDDEYDVKWDEKPGKYMGVAQSEFKLRVTPYNNVNSNCD